MYSCVLSGPGSQCRCGFYEQQPDADAGDGPAASGISSEAKAAAEEETRKRAENYEKAQQAQKRRMAKQAEAKARYEAKARTSTPPKYVQPKAMPAKPGPVPTQVRPVPVKPDASTTNYA